MFLDKDYYATPARGNVPAWTNEMAEMTWHHWLTFDGLSPQHRSPRPPCSCPATAASCRKTFPAVASNPRGPVAIARGRRRSGRAESYRERQGGTWAAGTGFAALLCLSAGDQ
jgi:hypothetical protein